MTELRRWLTLGLVAAVVALGAGWYLDARSGNQRVQALQDSVRGAAARVDSLRAHQDARDSAWAADSARWAARFDSLEVVAREAEEEAAEAGQDFELVGDTLRSTLELIADRFPDAEALVDTALAQVNRRDAHHDLQVARKDVVIRSLRETVRGKDTLAAQLRGRIADRDSTIAGMERQLRTQRELNEELEGQLHPSVFGKIVRDPAVKASIAAAFYLLGRSEK